MLFRSDALTAAQIRQAKLNKRANMQLPTGGVMKRPTPMADTMMAGAPAGMSGLKKGGGVKKMASGGFVRSADGIASKGKTKAKQITMCGGGKVKK